MWWLQCVARHFIDFDAAESAWRARCHQPNREREEAFCFHFIPVQCFVCKSWVSVNELVL